MTPRRTKRRTITIALTSEQYSALAGAVAIADAEDEGEELSPARHGEARARSNAWRKINRAWHAAGRPAPAAATSPALQAARATTA